MDPSVCVDGSPQVQFDSGHRACSSHQHFRAAAAPTPEFPKTKREIIEDVLKEGRRPAHVVSVHNRPFKFSAPIPAGLKACLFLNNTNLSYSQSKSSNLSQRFYRTIPGGIITSCSCHNHVLLSCLLFFTILPLYLLTLVGSSKV